jgi:Single-stranded DNA-binding protein
LLKNSLLQQQRVTKTSKDNGKTTQSGIQLLPGAHRQISVINTLKKGSKVYIEGKLKTRSWLDKNETTHYQTDVIVETIKMLDKKENAQQSAPTHQQDDLPFEL